MDIKQCTGIILSLAMVSFSLCTEIKEEGLVYIKPLPSSLCPAEPCLTLSQLAANHSRLNLLQSNVTLIILPGNHSLDAILSVTNTSKLFMLSNSFPVPIIMCQQNASFKFNNIGHVLIHGVIFVGCGNNIILSVDQFNLQDSSFLGEKNSTTALEIIKSNAIVVNTSFVSNTMGSYRGPIGILEYQDTQEEMNTDSVYAFVGGAIIVTQSNVTITGSMFERNHADVGGAIFSNHGSNIKVINSTFVDNHVSLLGGVLYLENDLKGTGGTITVINSKFNNNSAYHGGVITAFTHCTINITLSEFHSNKVIYLDSPANGGVLDLYKQSTATINRSLFHNNSADSGGGVVSVYNSDLTVHDSEFWENRARQFGGVITVTNGNVILDGSQFNENSAYQGGVLAAYMECSVTIHDSVFDSNEAKSDVAQSNGGVLSIAYASKLNITRSHFKHNTAVHGGVVISSKVEVTIDNCSFMENHAHYGGVIQVYQSIVTFHGMCNLTDNTAVIGGAIYADGDSTLNVHNELTIMYNTANDSGGGVYLYRSKLNCQFNSTLNLLRNRAVKGGGIHAINSLVRVFSNRDSFIESSIDFTKNTAQKGGGIYLELTTELQIIKSGNDYTKTIYNLHFTSNSADYGGAVYVADETNFDICASTSYYNTSVGTECFLQIVSPMETLLMKYNIVSIEFVNNSAEVSGPVLYGGLLDRCTLNPSAEILLPRHRVPIDGVSFITNTSNMNNVHDISSSPVQVCFCRQNGQPDCDYQSPSKEVMKGEKFKVSLVAVDQVNATLKGVTIYSSLKYAESGLGEGQMAQITTDNCTDLNFSIYSPHHSEEIILYPEGPCKNTTRSQKRIRISLLNCTCPVGFQPNIFEKKSNCVCDCDSKLHQYVTNCTSQTETLTREGNFWIAYLNISNRPDDYTYLTYPHCPLDYCLPPESKVQINLNTVNGADVQCANNRSGLLCGVCRPGFSLSLGSSRCITCSGGSSKEPVTIFGILLIASLAGICLVALVLILNLTVAIGTLNGLIFYANIINANSSIFFPSLVANFTPLYVFIAWLNLDIGFDVCFFKEMDTYWKTWIQLAFPTYIILLVVIVIILSKHSIRFTELLSKKNPVATLATLVLLSYAKFLRTIITTLSYLTLTFPDGYKRVWLPDATVEYLSGKHIILFIVAILILMVGIAYTCLLFFWQWILKWLRYQRLHHFIEVYHAPYKFNHRYWTGLLLLARAVLYLVFVYSSPGLNLLAIVIVTCGLLFLKGHFGMIYKNWIVDVIEMVCYLNTALFSAAILFTLETGEYQTVVTFTSVSVMFILVLFVLAYHIHTELFLKLWMKFKPSQRRSSKNEGVHDSTPGVSCGNTTPTSSTVDGLPSRKKQAVPSVYSEHKNELKQISSSLAIDEGSDNEDTSSKTPLDSTTPLLWGQRLVADEHTRYKYT